MRPFVLVAALVALLAATLVVPPSGASAAPGDPSPAEHWTAERMAAAVPRDLVVDERGLGYLRRADGTLEPHGHAERDRPPTVQAVPAPQSKPSNPGGGGSGTAEADAVGPKVTDRLPAHQATIGASATFGATITAPSGIRSVSFVITYPDGRTGSFNPSHVGNDRWEVTLQGFSEGDWAWHVVARDRERKGGNTTTTDKFDFTVDLGSGGTPPADGDVVTNSKWTDGGAVQTAAGRIYFEMPARGNRWNGYVCSGTVIEEAATASSIVLTAAHCVYDDVNKVFARNVLFIPDQANTTGSGTDLNCGNDPLGCWAPSHGVVDVEWTTQTFPANIPWDYAYYVVPDEGAHTAGFKLGTSEVLADAAGTLSIQFAAAKMSELTHALGYSYSEDPKLMYCAEGLGSESSYGSLWLSQCGLSGGASGGPWLQPVSNGDGPIVSVNSWGYRNQPGMGGPPLTGSAACVLAGAESGGTSQARGLVVTCEP
ncbi:trypsin-like serine peptidase [Nitriliruptor alkaliphilus]|uniref:trypsin-like serine peptidase n=1 Tax=Nitriliruptor alkaliphilus TaxID=427918 RepID=UPI0012ED637F|nr:hypothetical protein [Nitriliruptor alkaliphilus]